MDNARQENEPARVVRWVELVLASTAAAVGSCFYIGHETAQATLVGKFYYTGSLLSIFTSEQLVLQGVLVVIRYFAPKMLAGVLLVYLLRRLMTNARRRLGVTYVLGAVYGASFIALNLMHLFRMELSQWMGMVAWMRTNEAIIQAVTLTALIWLNAAVTLGDVPWLGDSVRRGYIVLALWGWAIVLCPALVPESYVPFTRTIIVQGTTQEEWTFISEKEGVLVLGNPRHPQLLLIHRERIDRMYLGPRLVDNAGLALRIEPSPLPAPSTAPSPASPTP